MPKVTMRLITTLSAAAAAVAGMLFCRYSLEILLTLAITFGTVAYHLGMRLLVGALFDGIMKNRADITKGWFQVRPWEERLHRRWGVKVWKDRLPTYRPELFDLKQHTLEEIAQAMCQAELVHETNMVLSFLPLLAARWFGAFYVFLLTSVGGALFDGVFVILQRYNRARMVRILAKQNARVRN